jgi:FG-GAP repeat/Putative Ig domain
VTARGEDVFGDSVALSGDMLLVGADGDDAGANLSQGSAYVFTRQGAVWMQQQKLTPSEGAGDNVFGISVAISGDTLAVGAVGNILGPNPTQGSAHVFVQPPCPALVFQPFLLSGGISGVPYQQSVTVSGGAGPYQFWLSGGALPPGMSLSPSGSLSGAPTATGEYNFTISAIDLSSLCSGSRAYTLTIAPCPTLTLDPPDLPNGATGAEYSHTLEAVGGRPPYSFVAKGALPPGLSLSADGVFSGAPTQAGNFNFTLLIRDANGCVSAWASSITVTQWDSGGSAAPRASGGGRQAARSRPATTR